MVTQDKLNKDKYKNAILYFIKYCNNNHLGTTKLNKLLYYLDFISYRDRRISITGDRYIHEQYGPIPENADNLLVELKKDGFIDVNQVPFESEESGFKNEFNLLKDPTLSVFDSYEKDLLKNICKEFTPWSTDKIIDQTHLEAPWFYSKPLEPVDYEYAKDIDFFEK